MKKKKTHVFSQTVCFLRLHKMKTVHPHWVCVMIFCKEWLLRLLTPGPVKEPAPLCTHGKLLTAALNPVSSVTHCSL